MSDFAPCVAFTLLPENEGGFVDNPADPGGATNMGITIATLSSWRGQACTVEDVRDLTMAEAKVIYQSRYWDLVAGASLPAGLDLMVFDFGVTSGQETSARMLQRILNVAQDGDIGPETLRAATGSPTLIRSRIGRLGLAQQQYYRELEGFPTFGDGWLARTRRRQAAALALTIHVPPTGASA